jgi:transposase InsO family protein
VCAAVTRASQAFGVPEEVLTDNGKQFTDRFGRERVEAAQAALDAWVEEYNSVRPHQALEVHRSADRFTPVPEQERAASGPKVPGSSRSSRSSGGRPQGWCPRCAVG